MRNKVLSMIEQEEQEIVDLMYDFARYNTELDIAPTKHIQLIKGHIQIIEGLNNLLERVPNE